MNGLKIKEKNSMHCHKVDKTLLSQLLYKSSVREMKGV